MFADGEGGRAVYYLGAVFRCPLYARPVEVEYRHLSEVPAAKKRVVFFSSFCLAFGSLPFRDARRQPHPEPADMYPKLRSRIATICLPADKTVSYTREKLQCSEIRCPPAPVRPLCMRCVVPISPLTGTKAVEFKAWMMMF